MRYIIITLFLLSLMVSSTAFAGGDNNNSKPRKSAAWQCRNIGKQKVKPFKGRVKKAKKQAAPEVTVHRPRYRTYAWED